MACITHHQTTSNAVCLDIRFVEAIPGEYVCQDHDSRRQQACAFNQQMVAVCDLLRRFLAQFLQSLLQVGVRHDLFGWIRDELEEGVSTTTHQNGTARGEHDWKRVYLGSDVSLERLYLLFRGRIVFQELLSHIACADWE
jgi:hypothetical protein